MRATRRLVVGLRLFLIGAVTTLHYLLWLLCRPLAWVRPSLGRACESRIRLSWARGLAACIGMRIRASGVPPRPPFFMVANHLSYMDVITLLATSPCTFLSKAEVARWPFIGPIARSTGTLFVDRTRRADLVPAMAAIERALASGTGVVVFPEGTSSAGRTVLPFRASIFDVPVRLGIPVHYAALSYSTAARSLPASHAVCWWGDAPFLPHLCQLLALPRFEARVTFGAEELLETDRKRLAESARAAVAAAFTPVIDDASGAGAAAVSGDACAR